MENNIGFIGLDAMGYGMAANVRKQMDSTATLYINDVHGPSCEKFKAEFFSIGPVEVVKTAKAVAQSAQSIIFIVPTGHVVKDVYLKCSTIEVETAKDIVAQLSRARMGSYIDTPVSGGKPATDKGTLSFLIGAPEAQEGIELDSISKRLRTIAGYLGPANKASFCGVVGNGLAAKICNNYLSCTILLANCEAMAFGRNLGLDKNLLHKVIHNSTGQNIMLDHVNPVPGVVAHAPSSNGYAPGFKSQMLVKDVGLGVDEARSVGINPSIGNATIKTFEKAGNDPICFDKDGSVVNRWLGGPED